MEKLYDYLAENIRVISKDQNEEQIHSRIHFRDTREIRPLLCPNNNFIMTLFVRRMTLLRMFNKNNRSVRRFIMTYVGDIDEVFRYTVLLYENMLGIGLDLYSPSYLCRTQETIYWPESVTYQMRIYALRPSQDNNRFTLLDIYFRFCVKFGKDKPWWWIARSLYNLTKCRKIHRNGTPCKHSEKALEMFKMGQIAQKWMHFHEIAYQHAFSTEKVRSDCLEHLNNSYNRRIALAISWPAENQFSLGQSSIVISGRTQNYRMDISEEKRHDIFAKIIEDGHLGAAFASCIRAGYGPSDRSLYRTVKYSINGNAATTSIAAVLFILEAIRRFRLNKDHENYGEEIAQNIVTLLTMSKGFWGDTWSFRVRELEEIIDHTKISYDKLCDDITQVLVELHESAAEILSEAYVTNRSYNRKLYLNTANQLAKMALLPRAKTTLALEWCRKNKQRLIEMCRFHPGFYTIENIEKFLQKEKKRKRDEYEVVDLT